MDDDLHSIEISLKQVLPLLKNRGIHKTTNLKNITTRVNSTIHFNRYYPAISYIVFKSEITNSNMITEVK